MIEVQCPKLTPQIKYQNHEYQIESNKNEIVGDRTD